MLVVLNGRANAGRAARRWPAVEAAIRAEYPDADVVAPASVDDAAAAVRSGVHAGHDAIVAAGGDGTVHLVLNALMDSATDAPRGDCALGAIGLGSSNDAHKPFGARLGRAPVRLDVTSARPVDVGRAHLRLPSGEEIVRYFLLNASLGIVAAGNHAFNGAGGLTAWLKPRSVEAAIAVTALRNIATFTPVGVRVRADGWEHAGPLTNLSVLKTVHFAGGMRYDTGVEPDDGHFDVNILDACGRPSVLAVTAGLYRGRFEGSRHARCERATEVEVVPDAPQPLELDGDVTVVASATLEVLPRRLRVCT